ncbi:hypothetical protein LWI28_016614 [Acer negundo]|uniref:Uncharacterized protein n=1 Tax=Acer negundo TaxID=4023 RepID=A0AAD5P394_ACENE|nr:hypothetical protein LWI28_016614 [Acer negundo]
MGLEENIQQKVNPFSSPIVSAHHPLKVAQEVGQSCAADLRSDLDFFIWPRSKSSPIQISDVAVNSSTHHPTNSDSEIWSSIFAIDLSSRQSMTPKRQRIPRLICRLSGPRQQRDNDFRCSSC